MKQLLIAILISQTVFSQDIIRGDTTARKLSIVFTGDEFADGGKFIAAALKEKNVKGSFFLTGNFYRGFKTLVEHLKKDGHYLGSHSDQHLLYCDWETRDSLLVTHAEFTTDLNNSYKELTKFGIEKSDAHFFLPPYEWYNDSIIAWTEREGLKLINYSPGTRSTADYTYPEMGERYVASDAIYKSILDFEATSAAGLNGFILLLHIGTDPRRTDKFYLRLPQLIDELRRKGYAFVRVDEMLSSQINK